MVRLSLRRWFAANILQLTVFSGARGKNAKRQRGWQRPRQRKERSPESLPNFLLPLSSPIRQMPHLYLTHRHHRQRKRPHYLRPSRQLSHPPQGLTILTLETSFERAQLRCRQYGTKLARDSTVNRPVSRRRGQVYYPLRQMAR